MLNGAPIIVNGVRMTPRWRIECRASTFPKEEWITMWNGVTGRRYTFVEREDAEQALAALKRIQPHAMMRIESM